MEEGSTLQGSTAHHDEYASVSSVEESPQVVKTSEEVVKQTKLSGFHGQEVVHAPFLSLFRFGTKWVAWPKLLWRGV